MVPLFSVFSCFYSFVFTEVWYTKQSCIEKCTRRRGEETQTLHAGCSKAVPKISPRRRPPSWGAGRPKFNQLDIVTNLQTQFGEDRCTQFRVIVVTDPQKQQTDRGDYNTLCHSLARSVITLLAQYGWHIILPWPSRKFPDILLFRYSLTLQLQMKHTVFDLIMFTLYHNSWQMAIHC